MVNPCTDWLHLAPRMRPTVVVVVLVVLLVVLVLVAGPMEVGLAVHWLRCKEATPPRQRLRLVSPVLEVQAVSTHRWRPTQAVVLAVALTSHSHLHRA